MDQQTEGLSLDQVLGNPTSPSGSGTATQQPDMLTYANQQLASGMSPDDAMQATINKYPEGQGFRFGLSPDQKSFYDKGASSGPLSLSEVLSQPVDSTQKKRQRYTSEPIKPDSTASMVGKSLLMGVKEGITDPLFRLQSSIQDYLTHPELRESQDAGKVTPEQKAAAELIGAKVGDNWGPVLKMRPETLAKSQNLIDQVMGIDPKEQAARDEAIAKGEVYSGPVEGLLQHSAVKDVINSVYNPNESNTLLYHRVNEVAHLMEVVKHPQQYDKEDVKAAQEVLDEYKKQGEKGTWDKTKEALQQIKEHPLGLVNTLVADPELMLAPEARIGTSMYGTKLAQAGEAAAKASRYERLAASVAKSANAMPDVKAAAEQQARLYTEQAQKLGEQVNKISRKLLGTDIISGAISGASINAAIAAEQEKAQQGYVQKGSLAAPMTLGAVLGGGLTALHGGPKVPLHEDLNARVSEGTTRETGPSAQAVPDVNTGKKPGEPLSPDTPINKNSHVPYYGGVDATGKVIHIDEKTPEFLPIKNIDGKVNKIPVLKTVAYHEQVEFPLMHMEGPIAADTLQQLMNRIGDEGKIPANVIEKLKAGKSLTYPEAHEIATLAENHLVRTLYKTDPKVYQDSLKPYIKDVGKANKTAEGSDIPVGLDTKPYDDMGHPEVLKGSGDRPQVDNVEPGAEKHTDNKQKGKIDKRLLAVGATAGAGATIGAIAAPEGEKKAGAIAGGLAGLSLAAVMGMGDIAARGLGKKEAGMFGGRKMATYNAADEMMASKMEEIGKTPEQIHLATGMSRDAAGNWVKEIPDQGMSLVPKDHPNWQRAKKEAIPLSTVVNHPLLETAYPDLLHEIKIKVDPELETAGSFNPSKKTLTIRSLETLEEAGKKNPSRTPISVIAHELQHGIQELEGFPRGSNVAWETYKMGPVRDYLEGRQEAVYQKWLEAINKGDVQAEAKYDGMLKEISNKIDKDIPRKAKWNYVASAGEVQARDVQTRMRMSPEEVATKSPRMTEDVPLKNQIVSKGPDVIAKFDPNQAGKIDPELLKKFGKAAALGTIGATLGAKYIDEEHKLKGAWTGAAIALVGGEVRWNKLFPTIKSIREHDPRFNVNDVLDNWDHARAAAQRTTIQAQQKIAKLAPGKISQQKITNWLDGDKSIKLTDGEYEAAKIARQFYDSLGHAAQDAGVLKDFLQDYINHEWGDNAKAKALQQQVMESFPTNMSPKDRHALARKFLTLEQGKVAGLVPKTENVVDLMGMYSNSMSRAMANKTLIDSLKVKTLDPKGEVKAIMGATKAPYNYVPINHPQLNGVRVHPSIAPSLDFLFYTKGGKGAVQALESANTAIKRMQVSFSLFHVKALIDAYFGANTLMGTFKNVYDIATAASGKSRFHKAYMQGGPGDIVDMAMKGGLKSDMGGHVSSEDIRGNSLYDALDTTSKFMDSMIPGTGKIPEIIKKANKLSDKFVWENVHTGLKGTTFMNVYERLQRSHAADLLKDPNYRMPSNEEIAKQAASFTNDVFGGLNWRRLADDATTKMGRSLALALASPAGRRLSQVMLFAPDWTYSTIRSFVKAIDQGSGLKGLLQPKYMADLHRQYIVRSAFIYLTLYNALNVAMSGHPIWDNKDPLTVDLGNGERMQANKHFLEVPHMLTNPAKFWLGKMGTVPSEALDQLFKREYLTPEGGPPMKQGRLEHAASRLLPFTLEGQEGQGLPERMSSLAGFPIYGQPTSGPRGEALQEEKKSKRKEKAKEAARVRKEKKQRELYGE